MSRFRPCIDLHGGQVKQIVGSSLDDEQDRPTENFISDRPASWFAAKYQADGLAGGHLIKLGPGNDAAAKHALAAYPGGLQIGGGINLTNAADWLDLGASHVIVTSYLFDDDGKFNPQRLNELVTAIGQDKIVIDLSCKRTGTAWTVAMNRWQTLTNLTIDTATLDLLSQSCDEFLIHAADVEGLCAGIDQELVSLMGQWGKIPMTYAGGIANMNDIETIKSAGNQRVDYTVGSSLDLFGGNGVRYADLLD